MGLLPCPLWSGVHAGGLRKGSVLPWNPQSQEASTAACAVAPGLRDRLQTQGALWQVSYLHQRFGSGHRHQSPAKSFHHLYPGLLKQEKVGHNYFPCL